MVKIRTLNSLPDLREAEFGCPYPRHGLNLLYWFAKKCVELYDDNTVSVVCSPSDEDYGFEWFHNKEELFPENGLTYYEVGNLHHEKADELPYYVWRAYTRDLEDSNADRIVVGIPDHGSDLSSETVYVTSHDDERNFDPEKTFRITPQLLSIISRMERKKFVRRIVPVAGDLHTAVPASLPRALLSHKH